MFCDAEKLARIEDVIKGYELKHIYPDWANGIVYLHFQHLKGTTKILAIKNNYYAGMELMQTASESAGKDN